IRRYSGAAARRKDFAIPVIFRQYTAPRVLGMIPTVAHGEASRPATLRKRFAVEAAGSPQDPHNTFTVILPALNEEAAVGSQVSALLAHPAWRSLPLAEILVVDNGSD